MFIQVDSQVKSDACNVMQCNACMTSGWAELLELLELAGLR
jgi:hypothetical protein